MATRKTQLVIGLPDTGKTTFLAALWYIAEQVDISTTLKVKNLGEDDHHLNDLRKSWLQCEIVERSSTTTWPVVSMLLEDTDSLNTSELLFPDIAGESYEKQWVERLLDPNYIKLAEQADGVLLFVHPQKVKEPDRLEDYMDLIDQGTGDNSEDFIPRNSKNDPTSAILIELLQILLSSPINAKKLNIAMVISAWDLIELQEPEITPEKWMEKRLSLLNQYLRANHEFLPCKVFGISAQGGDYSTDKDRLLNMNPAERIRIISSEYKGVDLTQVVKWSISMDS